MSEGSDRMRLEEIDWNRALPFTNIFGCFRMAIHPYKIMMALVMLILVYLCGTLLDVIFFSPVYPGERDHYHAIVAYESNPESRTKPPSLEQWRAQEAERNAFQLNSILAGDVTAQLPNQLLELDVEPVPRQRIVDDNPWPYPPVIDEINGAFKEQYERLQTDVVDEDEALSQAAKLNQDRFALVKQVKHMQPKGLFVAAMEYKLSCLNELVQAAANFNLGLGELLPASSTTHAALAAARSGPTVVGVLKKLLVEMPCWLWTFHPWFVIVYGILCLAIWALVGGAIARMAALHATRDDRPTPGGALTFSAKRFVWFFLAPLIPVGFCAVLGIFVAIGGLVFFNAEVLEWLGGLLFALALGAGLLMTLLLIGLVGGYNLLFPAIAVEGTDAFDAISRAYNFVFGRPWRMIFYNVVALIYGAIAYVFLSVVVYLTLLLTHQAAGAWVMRDSYDINRFQAMMPRPVFGSLLQDVDWFVLNWSTKVAAVMVHVWAWLAVAVLAAFAVSFYFCASTWVYLLLRRSAEGSGYDDVYLAAPEPHFGDHPTFADHDRSSAEAAATPPTADDDAGGGATPAENGGRPGDG